MQKFLLSITTVAVIAAPYIAANAAEKCVWLDSTGKTNCEWSVANGGEVEWRARCTYTGAGVSKTTDVRGIGVCSSMPGVWNKTTVSTADAITISEKSDENIHCWCRMISPAVSKWVYENSGTTQGECQWTCASNCASDIWDDSTDSFYAPDIWRAALFRNLD